MCFTNLSYDKFVKRWDLFVKTDCLNLVERANPVIF